MMKQIIVLVAALFVAADAAAPASAFGSATAPRMLARQAPATSSIRMEHIHRAQVSVGENEPIEAAVKRFRREVSRSGHLPTLRARKRFISNAEKRQDVLKKEKRRLRFTPPHLR